MTSAEFIAKWHSRFADNNTGDISEADLREFTTDMAAFFGATSTPPAPAGVSWNQPPTLSISGNQITVSDAEVQNGEDAIAIPAPSVPITIAFAASGRKRKDLFGAYYLAEPPYFDTITGTEVTANAIAFSPVVPEGFLAVSYLDVTDGSISQNQPIAEKFKGKWAEGIIDADTYWLTAAGIWRAKVKFGSATAPTAPDANWELVFAGGGVSDANALPYSPADNNNTTGFFAGLLTSGKLMVKSAFDSIVSKIGLLSALTTSSKTTLVAAINEVNGKPTGITLRIRPTNITGNFTLTQSEWDAYDMFIVNSASPIIITVALGTNIIGRQAVFYQEGAGTFTFQAGSGVTLSHLENKFTSYAQKATTSVIAKSNSSFIVVGQIKA